MKPGMLTPDYFDNGVYFYAYDSARTIVPGYFGIECRMMEMKLTLLDYCGCLDSELL
jgi:hypothetical protein